MLKKISLGLVLSSMFISSVGFADEAKIGYKALGGSVNTNKHEELNVFNDVKIKKQINKWAYVNNGVNLSGDSKNTDLFNKIDIEDQEIEQAIVNNGIKVSN